MSIRTVAIIADLVLLIIIAGNILSGGKKGAINKLSKLAALVCGVLAGSFLKRTFARPISDRLVRPFFEALLTKAGDKINIGEVVAGTGQSGASSAGSIELSGINIPGVDLQKIFSGIDRTASNIVESIEKALSGAINSAADTLAYNITGIVLLVLGTLLIYALVKLILRRLLDPLVSSIPVIGGLNRIAGAVIGALEGVIIAGIVLFAVYKLSPLLSKRIEELFLAENVSETFIIKQYFLRFPRIFI